ncbi:MAG TPA: nuclear transport factor 2 family protein [Acidobacteriaceae bacterium]|nr:nuclear transport factor 2 family protein [Acidobacteriaceae bacterium]
MRTVGQFFFDVPREGGLPSGTTMRRQQGSASYRPAARLKRALPALTVLLLLPACNLAWGFPHHERTNIRKDIESLEQQWRQAILTNNVSEMDHLLADDYIGITSNGTVESRAQDLAQRRAGTVRITELDLSDMHIRVYGDTAVVTSQAQLQGTNGASDISGEYRYTRVYNRRLGQWKIVSFEASRMNDFDARAKKH